VYNYHMITNISSQIFFIKKGNVKMTDILIRLFVKNSDNVKDRDVRQSYGKMAGIVGIVCNVFLSASKIITGMIISSVSILADGINNLSDATSSLITLIGFKLSELPADQEHPFGHARIEYVSGLIVAFLVMVLGFDLIKSSFRKIINPDEINFSIISMVVLLVSIAVKLWMSIFNKKIGKAIESTAIEATAVDSLNDVYTTSAVLVCTIIAKFTGLKLDGYVGMGVALFIMYSGIKLVKETLSPILGEAPDPELVSKIALKLRSYKGVLSIHDLVVHDYGPGGRCFATVHIEVDAKNDIMESHDVADLIERDFKKSGLYLVVHLDPIVTDDESINELREMVAHVISTIDKDITMHDFRVVIGYNYKNLIFDVVIPNGYEKSEEQIKKEIQDAVRAVDNSCYTVINIDRYYTNLN